MKSTKSSQKKITKVPSSKPRNPNWKNKGTIKHKNKKKEQKSIPVVD